MPDVLDDQNDPGDPPTELTTTEPTGELQDSGPLEEGDDA